MLVFEKGFHSGPILLISYLKLWLISLGLWVEGSHDFFTLFQFGPIFSQVVLTFSRFTPIFTKIVLIFTLCTPQILCIFAVWSIILIMYIRFQLITNPAKFVKHISEKNYH